MHIRSYEANQLPHLKKLVNLLNLEKYFEGNAQLIGHDPLVCSPHYLAEGSACAILLQGIIASIIWQERTGIKSNIEVNAIDALQQLHASHFVKQQGYAPVKAGKETPNFATFRYYKCADNKNLLLASGPPYAKLENGYLNFFNCGNNITSLKNAIATWNSFELESQLNEIGLPAVVSRSYEEWLQHPQGKKLSETPVIEIVKIADGLPMPFSKNAKYPLSGIKVLECAHVLAGPSAAMSLAEYGAQVLKINSMERLDPLSIHLAVNRGKRCTYLDFNENSDLQHMFKLMSKADVIVVSYRQSAMNKFNITPEKYLELNSRGGVFLSLNAYGHEGPWKERVGFDHCAQFCSGFSVKEGNYENPKFSPISYANDFLTGYFASIGVMTALFYRKMFGGSYLVKVSLTKTSMWLQELGLIDEKVFLTCPHRDDYPSKIIHARSSYGSISYLGSPIKFSNLPMAQINSLQPFGANFPRW